MSKSDKSGIRQQEDELFKRMATQRQPMQPDSDPAQQGTTSSNASEPPWYSREGIRQAAKKQFPGLTDEELDAWGA